MGIEKGTLRRRHFNSVWKRLRKWVISYLGEKFSRQKEYKENDLREEHAVLGAKRRAETREQTCRDL